MSHHLAPVSLFVKMWINGVARDFMSLYMSSSQHCWEQIPFSFIPMTKGGSKNEEQNGRNLRVFTMIDLGGNSKRAKVSPGSSQNPFIQKMGASTDHENEGWRPGVDKMNMCSCLQVKRWGGNGVC